MAKCLKQSVFITILCSGSFLSSTPEMNVEIVSTKSLCISKLKVKQFSKILVIASHVQKLPYNVGVLVYVL